MGYAFAITLFPLIYRVTCVRRIRNSIYDRLALTWKAPIKRSVVGVLDSVLISKEKGRKIEHFNI